MRSGKYTAAYRRLHALLRTWRLNAGLTQRALAERLRRPPSYVHKSEVGERRIDVLEFCAWCRACGRELAASMRDVGKAAQSRITRGGR